MATVSVLERLSALLRAHGVAHDVDQGWLVPAGSLPAMRASWHVFEGSGQLDVEVLLEGGSMIKEAFAGVGEDEAAIRDALENFTINSLHVLLAAFWSRGDPAQLTTERWTVRGKPFQAYVGNFGTRGSAGVEAVIPDELFSTIRGSVENAVLSTGWHWARHFFCDVNGAQTFEVLLDNEVWPAGAENMQALPWVASQGYYSVRHFLVLRSIDEPSDRLRDDDSA